MLVECNVGQHGVMLLAVIDGHGGGGVADLLKEQLVGAIRVSPAFQVTPLDLGEAIRQAFRWCNAQCRNAWRDQANGSGACVVLALIADDTEEGAPAGRRRCVVGWVGDSRAVLCARDGSLLALTQDHDPGAPAERERILAAGGFVTQEGRVQVAAAGSGAPLKLSEYRGGSSGRSLAYSPVDSPQYSSDSDDSDDEVVIRQIAVARDIGDTLHEAYYQEGSDGSRAQTGEEIISCEPDITETTLEAGRDALLVLGSDGLFAPLENAAVGKLAHTLWLAGGAAAGEMAKPKMLATKLVNKAKRARGNNDDTTALVLRLTRAAADEPPGALELDESVAGIPLQQTLSKPAVAVWQSRARAVSLSTPRGIGTPRGTPPRGSVPRGSVAGQRGRKRSIGQPRPSESRSSPL